MARRKRRLGQVFLVDRSIQGRIADTADVQPGEWVMEVGPGLGHLTQALLERGARVIAVEVDPELAGFLKERYPLHMNYALFLVENDFLKTDLPGLFRELGVEGPVKLVANIPYYITTPILEKLVEHRRLFSRIALTMQKEVAERVTARPGTPEWGSLSVFVQLYFHPVLRFLIPRRFFRPVPRVDSALVELTPRVALPVDVGNERVFFRLVRAIFQARRKTIRKVLQVAFPDLDVNKLLDTAGMDPHLRGETLDLAGLAHLARALQAQGVPSGDIHSAE